MSDNKLNNLTDSTFDKIKTMIDVNSVMGTPISTPDGTTIVPVCKVNYGFTTGGSDLPSKHGNTFFGGGSGAAVTIAPIAFLVVKDGDAKIIQVEPFTSSLDRAIQMAPDVIDKVTGFLKKDKPEE